MMLLITALLLAVLAPDPALETARDTQNREVLSQIVEKAEQAAGGKPGDAAAHYRLALAHSYLAEVALELRDKSAARESAESGIRAAQKAVTLDAGKAEYHRILGTLCGQVIPANTFLGMKYGRCALDSITKALELDPKSALAHVSRGVGNYYLPPMLGGGADKAIQDFRRAAALDPRLPEAQMWLGIALRKQGQNAEAREALARAAKLNPRRVWIRQQLEKTPAQ